MKKVLSTIVAALVTVAFAGIVGAAEPAKDAAAPVMPAGHPAVTKEEKKPAKKVKKAKAKKAAAKKEEVKPAEAPAAK
jgi:hypothetical protein